MNEIVNKLLLTSDKFMLEMHLRQSITKNKERIQKFKNTGVSRYIYGNELDKACFQQDKKRHFKELAKRTASDKILRDKAFNITKNPKYNGY